MIGGWFMDPRTINRCFEHPGLLWLLGILVPYAGICFYSYRKKMHLLAMVADPDFFSTLKKRFLRNRLYYGLFLLCLIIAIAGPQWGTQLRIEYTKGMDMVFAFDVSRSMELDDGSGSPGGMSRLDRARDIARVIVQRSIWRTDVTRLQGSAPLDRLNTSAESRIAVVVGKGTAVLTVPMTEDADAILNVIDALNPGMITAAGSNLEALLKVAIDAFPEGSPGKKRILLFTDGEETRGSLSAVTKTLQEKGIGVVAIGLGSAAGRLVRTADGKDFIRRSDGSPVVSQLRESVLQNLAADTGGYYCAGGGEMAIADLLAYLQQQSSPLASREYRSVVPSRQSWFVFGALFFLLLSRTPQERVWKRRKS
ncbi:MAG: vWA domain-containing protein [Termitinemataceae bacterium]